MTFKRFLGLGIALSFILAAVKIFFYQSFVWEDAVGVHYSFWLIVLVFSVAFVRRLGVISFLEAFVVIGVWIFLHLVIDLLITGQILGYQIFTDIAFLIGYLILIVAMFFFHKKRHVKIRREMAQK